MVEPVSATSAFLTSPVVGGAIAAAGSLIGAGKKQSYTSMKRNARFTSAQQRQYDRYRYRKFDSVRARVRDAKSAGLHPLAALGIAPASGGMLPGMEQTIPGQNTAGSAIETGINVMQGMSREQTRNVHSQSMQKMQLEEQELRNDWLKSQILNSENKRLAGMANSQRPTPDPAMRRATPYKPHPSEGPRRTFMHPDGSTYSISGGTPASVLEDEINEWADWMPHTLGKAYDVMKSQWQNIAGIDPGNTFYDRHLKKGYHRPHPKPRRNTRGKSASGPRSN